MRCKYWFFPKENTLNVNFLHYDGLSPKIPGDYLDFSEITTFDPRYVVWYQLFEVSHCIVNGAL